MEREYNDKSSRLQMFSRAIRKILTAPFVTKHLPWLFLNDPRKIRSITSKYFAIKAW